MRKNIKHKVNEFIKQHSLRKTDYDSLCDVAEELGFTVIEFTALLNSPDVEVIIRNLKLEKAVAYSRGFTYSDKNYRLIFINGDLSKSEKLLLLSHELGHIAFGHHNTYAVIGSDVNEEHMANEFAHYLLNRSVFSRFKAYLSAHKKAVIAVAVLVVIAIIGIASAAVVQKHRSYYGDYYVTPSGNKYHEAECIVIKDKTTVRRLTQEEFETGDFGKCKVCLPE